jgi:chemotaxis protein methyltransferase CheR
MVPTITEVRTDNIREKISGELLARVSEVILRATGLYFSKKNFADLTQRLRSAARDMAYGNTEELVQAILSASLDGEMRDHLTGYLTTGETFFFRDASLHETLEKRLLPSLLTFKDRGQRYIRIWSAGCASGEEAYSLAILFDRLLSGNAQWNLSIKATDINREALKKAQAGVYTQWSFRNTPDWVKERYFTKTREGRYEILPRIREMVTFSYLNLAEDHYPSLINNTNAMDIIFCRNVLMYFAPDYFASVIRRFYRCLTEGGWLIVSPVETSPFLFSRFRTHRYGDVTMYRKDYRYKKHTREQRKSTTTTSTQAISFVKSEKFEEIFGKTPLKGKNSSMPRGSTIARDESKQHVQEREKKEKNKVGDSGQNTSEAVKALVTGARLRANEGALDEALVLCDQAIDADALNSSLYFLKAMILGEMNRVDDAVQFLKRVIYLDSRHIMAHFSLGNMTSDTAVAERHYTHALDLLRSYGDGDIVRESEGMTARRLREIITVVEGRRSEKR